MRITLLSVILIMFETGSVQADMPVVINELMASNNSTIQDPQGQYDDWIELYNSGSSTVQLGGMYLTDDLTAPTKWQIPAATTIPAGGYLLIWADDNITDAGLHANFKLSADSEELGLFDQDGITLIDSITFTGQDADISYGRYPDATENWRYFGSPSPAARNEGGYLGEVKEPAFSHHRGFYDQPFSLTITTETADAIIYYTLDGSDPFALNLRGDPIGTVYTGPIPISRTTPLRVGVFLRGWKPSDVITHHYIFLDDVIRQPRDPAGFPMSWGGRTVDYAMDQRVVNDSAYRDEIKDDLLSTPSVCITIANEDFFGSNGIYANPTRKGDAWERPASMEWIDPAGGEHFGVNAGLRIQGGDYSRARSSNPKSGLQFFFRGEYGLSRLDYPLFPDTNVQVFNRLALREIWNYSWIGDGGNVNSSTYGSDYLRDTFARDTIRDMDRLTPHGRPIQVYINGLYWGMYIMTERIDDDFAADHLGGEKENYDVLEAPSNMGGSTTMKVGSGGQQATEAWEILYAMANTNIADPAAYEAIQEYVDVPAMIDYMLMIYYVGSRDAPVFLGDQRTPRNFYALRSNQPAGPFLFLPWDVEWSLENPYENRTGIVGVWQPHYLINKLSANPEFRILMADQIYRHFFHDGALTREQTIRRYVNRADEIYGAIVGESARWGDVKRSQPFTRVDWEREVDRLINEYFATRTDTVLNQLKQAGFYPSVSAPEFFVNGAAQHGGYIDASDSISMTTEEGTIWFTLDGTDPRLPDTITAPSQQVRLVPESASKRVFVPQSPLSDTWISSLNFDDSAWAAGAGGAGYDTGSGYRDLFEIDLYNQMYQGQTGCYIRIPFTVTEKLSQFNSMNLNIRYDDGFIAYLNGTEIARRNFTGTPNWNSNADSIHEDSLALNFEKIDVSSFLEVLRSGDNLLSIHGLNVSPTSSDFLISPELVMTKGANVNPANVSPTAIRYDRAFQLPASARIKARVLSNGTWSALNEARFAAGPVAENLRITELMYHPAGAPGLDDPNEEFIELTNIGAETINLNLVQFTNGIDFTFANLDLAPGESIVVVEDIAAFEARYGTDVYLAGQYSGRLANNGERIRLADAAGQTILDFNYKDGWYDDTDGRGFSLTIQNPANPDLQSWDDKSAWRPSTFMGGSPGEP